MKGFITILCFFLSLSPLSTRAETITQVNRKIDTLIQKTDPNMNIGIYVLNLSNKSVIYAHNADREYTPASTEKVLTAAASMLYWGPTHRYLTQLLSNAPCSGEVLQGNLTLKLDADPSFKREDLLRLFSLLRRDRVSRISGNILIDSRDLANVSYGPGWMREDSRYGYGAKVGPVILDENRFSVYVAPGSKVGEKAYIKVMEPETAVTIDNQLVTSQSGKNCGVGVKMDDNNVVHYTGCISIKSNASLERLAVKNPLKYLQDSVRSVLAELRIGFNGQMSLTTSIPNGRLLAQHKSRPLSFIIQQTLKPSDNLYAESLYLKLGAALYQQSSTWDLGRQAVQYVLTKHANVNFQDSHLSDGSGLSRYNLVTPRILVAVLSHMYHTFPVSSEFISALPIAGVDGTLAKRMKEAPASSYIRAKTGTMKGITALTGYIYTIHGQLFAFAIMSNNVSGGIYRYRSLQDQIVKYLSATQV